MKNIIKSNKQSKIYFKLSRATKQQHLRQSV